MAVAKVAYLPEGAALSRWLSPGLSHMTSTASVWSLRICICLAALVLPAIDADQPMSWRHDGAFAQPAAAPPGQSAAKKELRCQNAGEWEGLRCHPAGEYLNQHAVCQPNETGG